MNQKFHNITCVYLSLFQKAFRIQWNCPKPYNIYTYYDISWTHWIRSIFFRESFIDLTMDSWMCIHLFRFDFIIIHRSCLTSAMYYALLQYLSFFLFLCLLALSTSNHPLPLLSLLLLFFPVFLAYNFCSSGRPQKCANRIPAVTFAII